MVVGRFPRRDVGVAERAASAAAQADAVGRSTAASRRVRSVTSAQVRRRPRHTMQSRSGTAAATASCRAATLWSTVLGRRAGGTVGCSRPGPPFQHQALHPPADPPGVVVEHALGHAGRRVTEERDRRRGRPTRRSAAGPGGRVRSALTNTHRSSGSDHDRPLPKSAAAATRTRPDGASSSTTGRRSRSHAVGRTGRVEAAADEPHVHAAAWKTGMPSIAPNFESVARPGGRGGAAPAVDAGRPRRPAVRQADRHPGRRPPCTPPASTRAARPSERLARLRHRGGHGQRGERDRLDAGRSSAG